MFRNPIWEAVLLSAVAESLLRIDPATPTAQPGMVPNFEDYSVKNDSDREFGHQRPLRFDIFM